MDDSGAIFHIPIPIPLPIPGASIDNMSEELLNALPVYLSRLAAACILGVEGSFFSLFALVMLSRAAPSPLRLVERSRNIPVLFQYVLLELLCERRTGPSEGIDLGLW